MLLPRQLQNRCILACLLACLLAAPLASLAQAAPSTFSDPALNKLLGRMEANRKANDLLTEQYTSDEFWHNRNFDKKGKLKLDESANYENIVVEGILYRRKVEENGKPLSGKEAAAEQVRYDQAVAERRAMKPAQKRFSLHRSFSSSLPVAYLPSLFSNHVLRHEQLNGRDTLVVESTPKPDATPADDGQKSALSWKETTWIDVADAMPARIQAVQIVDSSKSFKGLSSEMDFIRLPAAPDQGSTAAGSVWLLDHVVSRGVFTLMWITRSYITEQTWSNFKRFQVDMRLLDDSVKEITPTQQ